MAWGLGPAAQTNAQEDIREQWESGGSREWLILEFSLVFKEQILEEYWVTSVIIYLWPSGVETVGEGSEHKWEEEEDVFDSIKG